MDEKCEVCGKGRRDGWLLIDDLCAGCGPDGFDARRDELRMQAAQLTSD